MDYDRNDALLHWLFRQTQGDAWFRPNEENISSGVALRISEAHGPAPPEFRVFPYENANLEPFETAVAALNPVVAVKVRNAAVHAALAEVAPEDKSIYVDSNTRIQILETMLLLPTADKEQCAAFIRDERVLVIWSDSLDRIIPTCNDFEDRLIKLLWRSRPAPAPSSSNHNSLSHHTSTIPSIHSSTSLASPAHPLVPARTRPSTASDSPALDAPFDPPSEKHTAPSLHDAEKGSLHTRTRVRRNWYGKKVGVFTSPSSDLESAAQPRRAKLYAPLYNGIAAGAALVFIGNGIKTIFQEYTLDASPIRFVLLALCPFLFCVSLFFTLQIIQNVTMAIGPIEHFHHNSKYYSAQRPRASKLVDNDLPHITIQMPVYKESLETVLSPSILSLKKAMQTYARQGGTSTIFINDDGLRLIPPADRDERLTFYANHNIGWIARPAHGSAPSRDDGGSTNTKDDDGSTPTPTPTHDHDDGSREDTDPAHAFTRAGRFKKASNMNYALALSLKAERHLEALLARRGTRDASTDARGSLQEAQGSVRGAGSVQEARGSVRGAGSLQDMRGSTPTPTPSHHGPYGLQYQHRAHGNDEARNEEAPHDDEQPHPPTPGLGQAPAEDDLEEQALKLAIEETWVESGHRHRPWAANGRAARMGEIVLLVDSDTVVPEDCLRDAAREMRECPTVAIIQHESDVMQVAHHYFENGIAYFTRRINRCISMACANGEVAPFMGHNAFLRWRAIQDAAFVDPADGKEKIWSESNVSEDFDMALRLMLKGYIIRWATYSQGGFKEGVSLSVDDELNRWQKYAYGCSELLFNPFAQWFRKGPIAHQIHKFMWCNAPMHYKISMMAYMFSYYGIAASVTISVINYVLLGFQFPVDGFYMHSFEIWLATTVVFFGSGTVGYTLLEYRLGHKQLIRGFLENLMWIPFFFFFFGGLSIPISQAILAHLFSYNISWSATIKEVQRSNFFKEIPKIAKRFWFPMSVSTVLILGMIICATSLVPLEWRVDGAGGWAVIFPLTIISACHILFPIVLNPWLMVFSY